MVAWCPGVQQGLKKCFPREWCSSLHFLPQLLSPTPTINAGRFSQSPQSHLCSTCPTTSSSSLLKCPPFPMVPFLLRIPPFSSPQANTPTSQFAYVNPNIPASYLIWHPARLFFSLILRLPSFPALGNHSDLSSPHPTWWPGQPPGSEHSLLRTLLPLASQILNHAHSQIYGC